jgi:hypothetical protein
MESLYWVITRRCNDCCPHCYNESSPAGPSCTREDVERIMPHLPPEIGRLILSGGEPLVEMDLLLHICDLARERLGADQALHIQTNGDLLTAAVLGELEAHGVSRIDVAGIDEFHAWKGRRRACLDRMLAEAGWRQDDGRVPSNARRVYAFWGATEDLWLRGNWPRGRALASGAARIDPQHNFCALWSGARGFLQDGGPCQEVAIQLWQVFPCCPGTWYSLGDARRRPIEEMLAVVRRMPAFRALDAGDPAGLPVPGEGRGYAEGRIRALGSGCLWCDEFFREHYQGPHGAQRPFR